MHDARLFDAAVVGAGVAGLWCATLLARTGLRVAVLEREAHAGGRARSWPDEVTGLEVDIGPHVLSSEHRNFMAMLDLLGTANEVRWQAEPLVTLLDGVQVLRVPNRTWLPPFHALPMVPVALQGLSVAQLLSHWRLSWAVARESETSLRALDGEDAWHWLRRLGVSERAINWTWRTAILALLNVRIEDCSAAAALRVMRLFAGRSGIHFGFPRVGLSQLYVQGCLKALRQAGGVVRMAAEVSCVEPHGESISVQAQGAGPLRARCCVVAVAPREAATLLAASRIAGLESLERAALQFEPVPYVSTFLWFDRRVTRERFWGRIWSPQDVNTDFYDLSNIRPGLGTGPSVIACNSIGSLARPDWSDADLAAATLREVAEFAPGARHATVRHSRVHRIAHAIPQPRPGTESLRPAVRTPVPNLFLAGDWCDTALPCSMESAARAGALAAEAVLQRLGRPATLALPAPETFGLPALVRKPG